MPSANELFFIAFCLLRSPILCECLSSLSLANCMLSWYTFYKVNISNSSDGNK
ncbi:hypothetical protein EVA_11088 [gut metagenome]|uniref:Uncharacterized protein n=1 Tax=gut metagenome TaxID=749906 RepID=J9CL47_9ZZZZ